MAVKRNFRIPAALTGMAFLAACVGADPIYSAFNREAGALVDTGNFGNATMNNHQVMTGEKRYAYDLSQRFASDVLTTVNFALTEAVTPTGDMTVDSIIFSAKKAGPNLFLYTTVKVVLEDGSPVSEAMVEMTLTHSNASWNFSGNTSSDGTVVFTLHKAPVGSYTATVNPVSHLDYDWDGVTATESCTLYTDGTITQ